MSSEEILDKLREIITKLFRKDDLVVSRETVASDVDGWDSLSHALLMLRVEKAFGVKFSDAEIGQMRSVGELADAVARSRGG